MKALILEDEGPALRRLEKLIKEIDPSMTIVAALDTIVSGIEFLENNEVDLIFSDIQLADGIAFEIYESVSIQTPVIFTTAFDEYAIKAFKANGIDYLLKPIDPQELQQAIEKAKKIQPTSQTDQLKNLLADLKVGGASFKKRFMVKLGQKIVTVESADIVAIFSEEKATYLLSNEGKKYLLDHSVDHINSLLDPSIFFRVNRKYLVSHKGIEQIHIWSNSRLRLDVSGLETHEVVVARERTADFKSWLDS